MREEFVSDLKEGMVTAKSVFTPDGLLIVPDGVTLTAPIIRHLDALNVFSIIIMIIVLFFRKGIMGTKEFSVRGIYNFLTGKSGKKAVKGGATHE